MIKNKNQTAPAGTEAEGKCFVCGKKATLQNEDDSLICEECAQSISSHAAEMGY